jgi:hypothetical protein
MLWWENLVDWLQTEDGRLVLLGGVVPFVAILAAGLLAAAIARRSVSRVLARRDREARGAVIGLLVDVARQASMWSSSSPGERTLIERAAAEADLAVRLLPAPGALLAAEWASYQIASLRRASAAFSLEFDTPLAAFRDRLLEWHRSPRRGRKAFEHDLTRWRADDSAEEHRLHEQSDDWTPALEETRASPFARRDDARPTPPSGTESSLPLAMSETTQVQPVRSFRSPASHPDSREVERPTDEEFRRASIPARSTGEV